MYGWIDLADVIREDQVEALSNIGQMLKSQDRESQKLAISLLLASEFSNIWKASLDCGSIKIHYNIGMKSYMVKRDYSVMHHRFYTIKYVLNVIQDFIDHETSSNRLYYWNVHYLKASVILDLISVLTLAINRTIELGQSFI